MANKIFSISNIPLDNDYIKPEYVDVVYTPVFLAEYDDKSFYSYDPDNCTVNITLANDTKYGVKIYDKTNSDDSAILTALFPYCNEVISQIQRMKDRFNENAGQFDVIYNILNDVADFKTMVNQIKTDIDNYISNLGFPAIEIINS